MTKQNPRNLTYAQLVAKALEVGWKHSAENHTILLRKVPFYTKATYYTNIFKSNDSAFEHIASINLKYLGGNSRVWKIV